MDTFSDSWNVENLHTIYVLKHDWPSVSAMRMELVLERDLGMWTLRNSRRDAVHWMKKWSNMCSRERLSIIQSCTRMRSNCLPALWVWVVQTKLEELKWEDGEEDWLTLVGFMSLSSSLRLLLEEQGSLQREGFHAVCYRCFILCCFLWLTLWCLTWKGASLITCTLGVILDVTS